MRVTVDEGSEDEPLLISTDPRVVDAVLYTLGEIALGGAKPREAFIPGHYLMLLVDGAAEQDAAHE